MLVIPQKVVFADKLEMNIFFPQGLLRKTTFFSPFQNPKSQNPYRSFIYHVLHCAMGPPPPIIRRLCTLPEAIPMFKNLCHRYRHLAISEARRALTDYLHTTRSLPFSHADLIASNSPLSLSSLLSQIPFAYGSSPSSFPRTLRRFLSYHPVNEFDFFFESIGLTELPPASRTLFLSDDAPLLAAVDALVHFGFPWTRLGLLYRESPAIFREGSSELLALRLRALESLGFRRASVIGICLAFPCVLTRDCDPGSDVDSLFRDLKRVFVDFDLDACAGDNVDAYWGLCRKIRVFYDAGAEKGSVGEFMGRNRRVFYQFDESFLAQRLDFFRRLGMDKEAVGVFVLEHPETLDFDLENTRISIPEYLKIVGLSDEEVTTVSRRCPYAMGKNKLLNLPGIMRGMDLHEWFLDKIVNENYRYISPDCASATSYDEKLDREFVEGLERIKSTKMHQYLYNKLDFMLSIGFGENKITTRAIGLLHSNRDQLQERFDCLIELGVKYTMLCTMLSAVPKFLNQGRNSIREKVNYLCSDLNYSLEYLQNFPAFLCFDLENRIKPRYRILNWLKEIGLLHRPFSPATVLANSEKKFITNLWSIHPAAPKHWLECFSSKNE